VSSRTVDVASTAIVHRLGRQSNAALSRSVAFRPPTIEFTFPGGCRAGQGHAAHEGSVEFTMRKFARLAAAGALGVAVGALGLYVLIAFAALPTPTGGMDVTLATVTWISAAVPITAVVAAHVAYALILFRYSKT